MILDFDYLPLPAVPESGTSSAPAGNRAAQFQRKDANRDGRLSFEEFGAGRGIEEAKRWFELRDVDGDKFLSREEFVPGSPLPRTP